MMTTCPENDLIEQRQRDIARRLAQKYGGHDQNFVEELESAALHALVLASRTYAEKARPGVPFDAWAFNKMRWSILNHLNKRKEERGGVNGHLSLDAPSPVSGDSYEVADRKAQDPALVVEAQESFLATQKKKRGQIHTTRLSECEVRAPDADAGKWVAQLRAACFDAVSTQDMTEVMQAVVKKAKKGNLGAVKLLLDYLAGGKSGVGIRQTVVIQQAIGGGGGDD